MMNKIYKHVLVASLLMMGGTAMAQTLNSAYFTDDYKFRHDMNLAFENKQNYITIPALGNINVNLQGNFAYKDVVTFPIGQLHFLTARQFSTPKYLMIFP